MDPNQTWKDLSEAFGKEWERVEELAADLSAWIESGGFPPKITGIVEFDKCVVRRTLEAIGCWDVF
jgi:hypothetical protein